MEFPPELERMVAQEDREMRLHQEETKVKNLGFGDEKNEVKVGIGKFDAVQLPLLEDRADIGVIV